MKYHSTRLQPAAETFLDSVAYDGNWGSKLLAEYRMAHSLAYACMGIGESLHTRSTPKKGVDATHRAVNK